MSARQDIASASSSKSDSSGMADLLTDIGRRCVIPAPHSWAAVDTPRPPRLMTVTVGLPDGRTSYQGRFASTMDAYEDAYLRYPHCTRITVEPLADKAAEVQP
jgi:hypothetical protein